MARSSDKAYCAFCKIERRVYSKKHITSTNVLLSLLTSLLLMFLFWQKFEPKFMILFVMCLAIAESFIQLRWRLSINCQHCGFDPALYVADPKKAEAKVIEVLAQKKESGDYLLSAKNPFANLAKRPKLPKPQKSTFSRQI